MYQKSNIYKILKTFFDDPSPEEGFQLRELSRMVKIAPKSVKAYLKELEKEGMIKRKIKKAQGYPIYFPNRESEDFRLYKKLDMIIRIFESGLAKYLDEKCSPDAMILFGSASRGEDLRDSDIDLFLLCKDKNLDLEAFEKQLKRKISIFFSEDFKKLSRELKNNILNGVVIKGYLEAF